MSFSGLPGRGTLESWAIGTTVAPSEFFWFESCIVNAIDGGAGGTYAPSAQIVLGGSGIQVVGPAQFAAACAVDFASGTGYLTCGKRATFTGDTFFENATQFKAYLQVTSTGSLQVYGTMFVYGACEFVAAPVISADITSSLHFGQGGYIRKRRLRIIAGGAGQTVSLEFYDVVFATIAGDLILASYGGDGAIIRIVNETTGNVVVKKETSLDIIITMSTLTWVDLIRDPTTAVGWRICARGGL